MLPELRSKETELNNEFKKLNKASLNVTHKTDEQRAKADPNGYLTRAFPKGGSGRSLNLDIVVLKLGLDDRLKVSDAAESQGLTAVSVAAPWISDKKPVPDHWVVIGRDSKAVLDQVRQTERATSRSKQVFSEASGKATASSAESAKVSKKVEKTVAKSESSLKKAAPKPAKSAAAPMLVPMPTKKQTAQVSEVGREIKTGSLPPAKKLKTQQHVSPELNHKIPLPPKVAKKSAPTASNAQTTTTETSDKFKSHWDVQGEYHIICSGIEEQWGDESSDPLSLFLYLETDRHTHTKQLFAKFDFRVVEGIMRFVKPTPAPKAGTSAKGAKRKHEYSGSDVDMHTIPSYDSSSETEQYHEKDFHLTPQDQPIARRPTWQYRWRGRETGEGEIQVESDHRLRPITFSDNGNKLEGTFHSEFIGNCSFTGVKVRPHGGESEMDVKGEWLDLGEDEWEEERVGRW